MWCCCYQKVSPLKVCRSNEGYSIERGALMLHRACAGALFRVGYIYMHCSLCSLQHCISYHGMSMQCWHRGSDSVLKRKPLVPGKIPGPMVEAVLSFSWLSSFALSVYRPLKNSIQCFITDKKLSYIWMYKVSYILICWHQKFLLLKHRNENRQNVKTQALAI